MTTYYVTKYALSSKGKIAALVADGPPSEHGYVYETGWAGRSYKIDRDVFTTPQAAIAAAEAARKKKIASLRKQIAALEKVEFFVEGGAA